MQHLPFKLTDAGLVLACTTRCTTHVTTAPCKPISWFACLNRLIEGPLHEKLRAKNARPAGRWPPAAGPITPVVSAHPATASCRTAVEAGRRELSTAARPRDHKLTCCPTSSTWSLSRASAARDACTISSTALALVPQIDVHQRGCKYRCCVGTHRVSSSWSRCCSGSRPGSCWANVEKVSTSLQVPATLLLPVVRAAKGSARSAAGDLNHSP